MNTIETLDTSPFKKLVLTIGALPTAFLESMTYYEALAWLVDYLENQVVKTVNNNAEALQELKDYVENYFNSADFQQLVNNKLDEMAEDGTLGELIGQYISDEYVKKTDYATDEVGGAVKVGDSLEIEDGVLNIKEASAENIGGVKVGDTLNIDENGVLNTNPVTDFISDIKVNTVRYQGEGGYTNVYYSIIPSAYKPVLRLANGEINSEQYPWLNAYDNKTTLTTNAGVYITSDPTHPTMGTVVVDGEVIQVADPATLGTYNTRLLYMTASGRLDAIDADSTQAEVESVNPVWAVQGFQTFVENYNLTDACHSNTDFRERTNIGQDGNGNYIIFVTGGRNQNDVGFNPLDCYNFCVSVGFNPRILYNLDGGGSSQMVHNGILVNQLASDTAETRKVPNFLCWISNGVKNQSTFDGALAINNAILANRINAFPTRLYSKLTASENVTLGGSTVVDIHNGIVTGCVYITTSDSIAQWGSLVEGLPIPKSTPVVQIINQSDATVKIGYLTATGKIANWNKTGALPAGSYIINLSYVAVDNPVTRSLGA